MALEPVTATGLSSWASFLINGDDSGLEPGERKAAEAFAAWLGGSPVDCQDAGFIWRPDSFRFLPLGGDCQTYTALIETAAPTGDALR
jgi:hypothetical protein